MSIPNEKREMKIYRLDVDKLLNPGDCKPKPPATRLDLRNEYLRHNSARNRTAKQLNESNAKRAKQNIKYVNSELKKKIYRSDDLVLSL